MYRLGAQTRIVLGTEALRPVERAALYLQTQVERRCGWRWEIVRGGSAGPGDIVLGIPGDGVPASPLQPEYPEEVALWCGGEPDAPSVFALAGGQSVAMVTAGKLARAIVLGPGQALLPSLSLRERPSFPVRGHHLCSHKQTNTYDKWDWAQWEEYLTELAAWGDNIAMIRPINPARWAGCLPYEDPPWFDMPERESEYYRQLEIQLQLPELCHELGMRYCVAEGAHHLFQEEVERHPELTKYGATFVCPNVPEARRRVRVFMDRLFSMLPSIDVLFLSSGDQGGCPGCEDCVPWAPVFIELVKEQMEQVRKYHPLCKIWVSQQDLSASDTETLLQWLDCERPDWIEAVLYGPFSEGMTFSDPKSEGSFLSLEQYAYSGPISGPVNRLRAAVPGEYQLILYPDEVHTLKCQYPVVGMDPVVQYIWQREGGPAPRPVEMAAMHAATCAASDGTIPYSEGNTDDLNKFIWSGRSWNVGLGGEQITEEYARWFFGADCAPQATAMTLKLEQILNGPLYGNSAVQEVRALRESCEARAPRLLENWRWLNLRVAALMLEYLQQVMTRDRELVARLRYWVAVWRSLPDPTAVMCQAIHYLERRFAETDGLLREVAWTRDKVFRLNRLAIRGVARLQASYMKVDVMLQAWKEALAKMERGELASYPEKRWAIQEPLIAAEDSLWAGLEGIPLVKHVQEFVWEEGETEWRFA